MMPPEAANLFFYRKVVFPVMDSLLFHSLLETLLNAIPVSGKHGGPAFWTKVGMARMASDGYNRCKVKGRPLL